jgi:DNA modification methylase
VNLIYLDPPYCSGINYGMSTRSLMNEAENRNDSSGCAFSDTWRWTEETDEEFGAYLTVCPSAISTLLMAFRRILGNNGRMAYLLGLAPRLVEIRRVLAKAGSIYAHCDTTVSPYLRLLFDAVFGHAHYRNEIIWKRTSAHSSARRFASVHDVILYYSNDAYPCWNPQFTPYRQDYIDRFYRQMDSRGRRFCPDNLTARGVRNGSSGQMWRGIDVTRKGLHWKFGIETLEQMDRAGRIYWPPRGTMPRYRRYLDEMRGVAPQDVITDIGPVHAGAPERTHYPTQKPLELLRRIVKTSSNPGDTVLDPFAGSGTTLIAAHELSRSWIGIDKSPIATETIKQRFRETYSLSVADDHSAGQASMLNEAEKDTLK